MKTIFKLLSKLWFVLLLLLVGGLLFTGVGQAKDIFFGLAFDDTPWTDFALLCSVLLLWGGSVWYSSRLLVRIVIHQQPHLGERIKYIKFIPRIIGLIPFIIILFAIDYGTKGCGFFQAVIIFTLGVFFYLFVHNRRPLFRIKQSSSEALFRIKNLPRNEQVSIYIITALAVSMVFLFIILSRNTAIELAIWIGPLSILILGMAIWTWGAAIITWLDSRTEWPISILILIAMVGFSYFNDNDEIQIINTQPAIDQTNHRPNLADHFKGWHASAHRPWNNADASTGKQPIYIIAGEGGGSRASFWTSGILSKLDSMIPNFQEQVYVMSTVSGSSVGAGIYNAARFSHSSINPQEVHRVAGGDFLSPINLTLISGEIIQGVWPWGISKVDRAKYLEDAWSRKFSQVYHEKLLDRSMLELWQPDAYSLPINVFNSTVAETGQKAYLSPIRINLPDVMDVLDEVPCEIPLKTSMSLSARFPFFTSTGTINDKTTWEKPRLNLTDGGYYENTGLETAMDIYNKLDKLRTNSTYANNNFIIIFIQNSSGKGYTKKDHLNFMDIISLPLSTLLSTWATESIPMKRKVTRNMNLVKADNNVLNDMDKLITLRLVHDTDAGIPLSRYISETTKKEMIDKMNNILNLSDSINQASMKTILSYSYE